MLGELKFDDAMIKSLVTVGMGWLGMGLLIAQPGGLGSSSPNFGGSLSRIFGANTNFTTTVEIQATGGTTGETTLVGNLAFDDGKSRFEMDLGKIKSSKMPPGAAEQMKALGMDQIIVISRPDLKVSYMVYPGVKAFAEMPLKESESAEAVSRLKLETTELGRETVDGHPTIKNRVTVTGDAGKRQEFVVWNATDLNTFPVKLEMEDDGTKLTMSFKSVKLVRPPAAQFETARDLKRYDSVMAMMQEEMLKKMGNMTPPPGR